MLRTIEKVTTIYFSPCGNAEKIAKVIADRFGKNLQIPVTYVDVTLPENRTETLYFAHSDLVVFCVPVYAGRIPNKILPAVQSLFLGNQTMVVPIVTFGNRSFDSGLKELCFELNKNDFLPVGAAAFVSEHSFSADLAAGRPDEADVAMMHEFADTVMEKIKKAQDSCPLDVQKIFLDIDQIPGNYPLDRYYTPLGTDGKPAIFLKAKPKTDLKSCVKCGVCTSNCPMGAIVQENPYNVTGICIKCQACIKKCPNGAKYFDDEAFLSHVKMLEETYTRKAESFVFL
ncbi:MAG: 4Fe-4S binding protein [Eubacterium sp.]|nr:4Fe-4S binding protein [Eubacterium sp.]